MRYKRRRCYRVLYADERGAAQMKKVSALSFRDAATKVRGRASRVFRVYTCDKKRSLKIS